MTLRSVGNEEATAFGRAIDGRYSAQKHDVPGIIGYGPTLRHAREELGRRLSALHAGIPIGAVLTVRRDRNRLWTARLDLDLTLVGEGQSMTEAEHSLIDLLPKDRKTQIARLVWLEQHDDHVWSARASDDWRLIGVTGWGGTANEAEADLLDEEEAHRRSASLGQIR